MRKVSDAWRNGQIAAEIDRCKVASVPTTKDVREFDRAMLTFYKARVVAGSFDPVGDTETKFGEDAKWCVDPKPFTYSDSLTD